MMVKNKILLVLAFCLLTVFFSCSKKENPPPVDNTASHTITDINPSSGPKGTEVIITGTGFNIDAATNVVKFNGVTAVVTSATETELVVEVPAKAKDGALSITISGKTATGPTFDHIETYTISTFGTQEANGANVQYYLPTGVAADASGNVYVADSWNHRIIKITPVGVVSIFAGSSTSGADNGTGTAAKFNSPSGVAVDASGNVYVADKVNSLIRKITPAGVVTTVAGSSYGYQDGTGAAAMFRYPRSLTIDASGNLFVADEDNHLIRKVTPSGVVSTFAGSTSGFLDGTGIAAKFSSPGGITIDKSGNLYVGDSYNHAIRKISPSGVVTTLAGSSSSTAGYLNGTGSVARFYLPRGVAVDVSGNVYVADRGNDRIRKITPTGVVTTVAGSTQGELNGIGTASKFYYPEGVTINAHGDLYVADQYNHRIRKIIVD